ncbi:MAG: HAMP domain-containing histidine kinase [Thiovulaceae bacterium]|nr:HAMP domain-containing histidine kinase [Sulfurimonadaceae bacterium]
MFRNVEIVIFLFFVITTLLIITLFASLREAVELPYLVGIILVLILIAGMAIAKLSIEPLREHFNQLEHYSKEILHELNLPINTIMTNTSMLKKNIEDERSLKRFKRIEAACSMLQERYQELDYMIKKQMQRERVELFDVADLVQERLRLLKPLYSSAQFDEDLESISVNIDRIGLSKVIDNIIDNGVKYSPQKAAIKIVIRDRKLSISDKGRGIDEVELFQIFDRYYQSDENDVGFGIGLGLVKSYCDRYKIKLHVRSKKDEGTTMQLDFSGVA